MAKDPKQKSRPERLKASTSGIVEAVEQDVELSLEQVKEAAHEAVEAVEKKLGIRKPVGAKAKTVAPPKSEKKR